MALDVFEEQQSSGGRRNPPRVEQRIPSKHGYVEDGLERKTVFLYKPVVFHFHCFREKDFVVFLVKRCFSSTAVLLAVALFWAIVMRGGSGQGRSGPVQFVGETSRMRLFISMKKQPYAAALHKSSPCVCHDFWEALAKGRS